MVVFPSCPSPENKWNFNSNLRLPSLNSSLFFTISFLANAMFRGFVVFRTLESLTAITIFDALFSVLLTFTTQTLIYDHGDDHWDHKKDKDFVHFVFDWKSVFQMKFQLEYISTKMIRIFIWFFSKTLFQDAPRIYLNF